MRILLVEDYLPLQKSLAKGLREAGYAVDVTGDGKEGLWYAMSNDYDAIILDLMLPGVDGLSILRKLRAKDKNNHVLILTAKDTVDDRIKGLDLGADDYLVKPFSFVELLARVEALGRRSDTIVKQTILRVGDLAIDLMSRTASRRGKDILLFPREFQLLEYLVRNEGRIVSRTMLLQHVWDLHFDPSTNIIDVYVGRVRRKVDGQQAYPLIHTVRGIGYCLRAPG